MRYPIFFPPKEEYGITLNPLVAARSPAVLLQTPEGFPVRSCLVPCLVFHIYGMSGGLKSVKAN